MPSFFDKKNKTAKPVQKEDLTDSDRQLMAYLSGQGADLNEAREVRHWLYFPDQVTAEKAGRRLSQLGYEVVVAPSPQKGGGEWRVLAKGMDVASPEAFPGVRQLMEELAAKGGGAYDGWEASAKSDPSKL
jgi:regulator of RNase E activity RraB